MNRRTYVANLLKTRIRQHRLNHSPEHFNELFKDFYQAWAKTQARSPNPKEASLWLLNALNLFLDLEKWMQENYR